MLNKIESNVVKLVSQRNRNNGPLNEPLVKWTPNFSLAGPRKDCSLVSRVLDRPQAQLPVLTNESPILTKEKQIGEYRLSQIQKKNKKEPGSSLL